MTIANIIYNFEHDSIFIYGPYEITRENDKSYFTDNAPYYMHNRFPKNEIGKTLLKAKTQSPYLSLILIDSNEEELINGIYKWFTDKATDIKNKKVVEHYGI